MKWDAWIVNNKGLIEVYKVVFMDLLTTLWHTMTSRINCINTANINDEIVLEDVSPQQTTFYGMKYKDKKKSWQNSNRYSGPSRILSIKKQLKNHVFSPNVLHHHFPPILFFVIILFHITQITTTASMCIEEEFRNC